MPTDYYWMNGTQTDTTWIGANTTLHFFAPYREIEPLWSDLRERDRFNLACARPLLAPPLATPTLNVRPAYVVRSLRLSGWLRKVERSPLNKRALSRR